jgi:hypothetical protein
MGGRANDLMKGSKRDTKMDGWMEGRKMNGIMV